MSSSKPNLSITLPRNFQFHYNDGEAPRTPEASTTLDLTEPPQPPRQTYKVRRRRRLPTAFENDADSNVQEGRDMPIPTIELPEQTPALDEPFQSSVSSRFSRGLLAPHHTMPRLVSPPKTPAPTSSARAGLPFAPFDSWETRSQQSNGETATRPSSVCSIFSDSSASSSVESLSSYPSFGGSCTSPDSDSTDPFTFKETKTPMALAPSIDAGDRPQKRMKTNRHHQHFTEDMDHHLWTTYMSYLQDPTVTPFKMLPGTAPPLGVCARVAREAKRTWKGEKTTSITPNKPRLTVHGAREDSPDTIRALSEEEPPVASSALPRHVPLWPGPESVTRKRLRELCKNRPTLSAHYHRFLSVRTPSPFQSSSSRGRSSRFGTPVGGLSDESRFSRDMNLSLHESTSSTMGLMRPLSQLAQEMSVIPEAPPMPLQRTPRPSLHQKSQSLHAHMGLGSSPQSSSAVAHGLASPFVPRMTRRSVASNNKSPSPECRPASRIALESPIQIHAPKPNRSLKRRAVPPSEDTMFDDAEARLQEIFSQEPAVVDNLHFGARRIRARGFSLGDMISSTPRHAATLFEPTESTPMMVGHGDDFSQMSNSFLAPPGQSGAAPRLGSPFRPKPFSTLPRSFARITGDNEDSLEERMQKLGGANTLPRRF